PRLPQPRPGAGDRPRRHHGARAARRTPRRRGRARGRHLLGGGRRAGPGGAAQAARRPGHGRAHQGRARHPGPARPGGGRPRRAPGAGHPRRRPARAAGRRARRHPRRPVPSGRRQPRLAAHGGVGVSGAGVSGGPVRVGVIGAGVISTEYLRNLTRFPDLDVRAVGDLDAERARAQADAFGVPRGGGVAEVFDDDAIELVVNLTVPQAHVDVALQAIAAGKHVWNEKPIGLDREGTRKLLDAARASGLRVATAPDTFLGPGIQTARRLVEGGAIGRPLAALTLRQSPGPESWHPSPDFVFQDGAGPLFDLGPYSLTALVQLLGPITQVSAVTSKAREVRTVGSGPRAGQ